MIHLFNIIRLCLLETPYILTPIKSSTPCPAPLHPLTQVRQTPLIHTSTDPLIHIMPGVSTWHEHDTDKYIDPAEWSEKCDPHLGSLNSPGSILRGGHLEALQRRVDPTIGIEATKYLPTIKNPRDALMAYLLASDLCRTIPTTLPTAKDHEQTFEFIRGLSERHPTLSAVCADAENAFTSRMKPSLDLPSKHPRDALMAYLMASASFLCRTIRTTLSTAKEYYEQTLEFIRALFKRHPTFSAVCADAEAAFTSRMNPSLDLPTDTGTAREASLSAPSVGSDGQDAAMNALIDIQHHRSTNPLFGPTLTFRNVLRFLQDGEHSTFLQLRDMMADLM